jgi:acyl carrier protein
VNGVREKLLAYINTELRRDGALHAGLDTPLFEDGGIDSLQILKLIAFVEWISGRKIPDEEIVMKNFRTVNTIAAHFERR